jgi:hypothetical protein
MSGQAHPCGARMLTNHAYNFALPSCYSGRQNHMYAFGLIALVNKPILMSDQATYIRAVYRTLQL